MNASPQRSNWQIALDETAAAVALADNENAAGLALVHGAERIASFVRFGAHTRAEVQDALLQIARNHDLPDALGEEIVLELIARGLDAKAHFLNGHVHIAADDAEPAPAGPDDYGAQPHAPIDGAPEYAGPRPLVMLDPTLWEGQEVPPRPWLIRDRIPAGKVTLLSGDGAAGKTTIALQLAVATVRGTDWLGSAIDRAGPAVFFSAEEDSDEVHRRLAAILAHHRLSFADLVGLHLHCLPGESAVLGIAGKTGIVSPTDLYLRLEKTTAEIAPALIIVEAAADVFAGNENDRSQVRQFIALLQRIAGATGAAVLLLAHPSLTGLSTGSGLSGSTGWSNSVRSRLYFKAAGLDVDEGADSDVRELRVMKSNYGPAGEVVRLRWQAGVFVPVGSAAPLAQVAAEADADAAYLDCLDAATAQNRRVYPEPGRGFAPKVFEDMPQARGLRWRALHKAQERLFAAERVRVVESGPPSKRVRQIARTPMLAEAAE
jgi:RecA-family ATPase